jgi:hypothetical protein
VESIEETVVESKKKTFCAVNLKARYGHEIEEHVVYNAPTLLTAKVDHDKNSYTGFYQLFNREEAFLNHEDLDESERTIGSEFRYVHQQ